MLETIARAIYENHQGRRILEWASLNDFEKEFWREAARAARNIMEPMYGGGAVLQNDLAELCRLLELPDGAQPKSPHDIFQDCLVKVRRLVKCPT